MTDDKVDPRWPLGGVVASYDDFVQAMVSRRHELGLVQREVDEIAGLQDGYTSKLEKWRSPGGRVAGPLAMQLWMAALGLKMLPINTTPGMSIAEQRAMLKAKRQPRLTQAQMSVSRMRTESARS